MRRVIAMRKNFKAFARGTIEFLLRTIQVLAFLRRYEDETILVVANLSRFSQSGARSVAFCGLVPMEVLASNLFPADQEDALRPHTRPARLLLVRVTSAD